MSVGQRRENSHANNAHVAEVMKELGMLLSSGPSLTFTSRVSD
jgi:hypothetical protein